MRVLNQWSCCNFGVFHFDPYLPRTFKYNRPYWGCSAAEKHGGPLKYLAEPNYWVLFHGSLLDVPLTEKMKSCTRKKGLLIQYLNVSSTFYATGHLCTSQSTAVQSKIPCEGTLFNIFTLNLAQLCPLWIPKKKWLWAKKVCVLNVWTKLPRCNVVPMGEVKRLLTQQVMPSGTGDDPFFGHDAWARKATHTTWTWQGLAELERLTRPKHFILGPSEFQKALFLCHHWFEEPCPVIPCTQPRACELPL